MDIFVPEQYLVASEDRDWIPFIIKNGYFDSHSLLFTIIISL